MDDFEKVLRYLDNKEQEGDFLNIEKGKTLLKTVDLVKKIVSNSPDLPCGHDIEDICAYYDNNIDETQKVEIENTLFSCDNCFKVYSQLKTKVEELENYSPQWLKEKVLEKNEQKKKNIFAIILKLKNSPATQASGLAVAMVACIFIFINPLSDKATKMEVAKAPQKEAKVLENVSGKLLGKTTDEIKSSVLKNTSEKFKENSILAEKAPSAPKQATEKKNHYLAGKSEYRNAGPLPDKPSVIKEDGQVGPVVTEPLVKKQIITPEPVKPVGVPQPAISIPSPEQKPMILAQRPEETGLLKNEEEQIADNIPLEKTETRNNIQNKGETDSLKDKEKTFDLDDSKDKKAKADSNKLSEPARNRNAEPPSVNTNKVAVAATPNEGKKREQVQNYEITINSIQIEKPGFVVIKKDEAGEPGEVLGSTKLLTPGKYEKLNVSIDKSDEGKKAFAVFYEDSNNNGNFDVQDKQISNKKILEISL